MGTFSFIVNECCIIVGCPYVTCLGTADEKQLLLLILAYLHGVFLYNNVHEYAWFLLNKPIQ